jgi:hypothetical protein
LVKISPTGSRLVAVGFEAVRDDAPAAERHDRRLSGASVCRPTMISLSLSM